MSVSSAVVQAVRLPWRHGRGRWRDAHESGDSICTPARGTFVPTTAPCFPKPMG